MPNEEWGTKRLCPTTGKRFYDLNKNPIISPYTGEEVESDNSKSRMIAADAEDAVTAKAKKGDKADDNRWSMTMTRSTLTTTSSTMTTMMTIRVPRRPCRCGVGRRRLLIGGGVNFPLDPASASA